MKESPKKSKTKFSSKDFPTLKIVQEKEIAMDFANKVYQKFDKLIKSIILFGSVTKKTSVSGSDIDVIILVDDASVQFDAELIAWYREELGKILATNPYNKELHINTIKLTTWWTDLLRGDPIIINIIRYGEEIIDFGGFFRPLKILLQQGKIKPTPEAIYTALQRAPMHLANSKRAEISAIEGVYWAMVDSAHALLIAGNVSPASPEDIAMHLRQNFVDKKMLNEKYVTWYAEVHKFYKQIVHGEIKEVNGIQVDELQRRAEEFINIMAQTIRNIT
jgi:predicted nucleotidyltransferase/uncharacterized protein (UPF0332 family)